MSMNVVNFRAGAAPPTTPAAGVGIGAEFGVGQAGRVPYEGDFAPDEQGFADAMRRLVELRGAPGGPHVDPDLVLDLPAMLPEVGIGGRVALEWLAIPALGQVSRLDHPGFLAHMDPPTPWMSGLRPRGRHR